MPPCQGKGSLSVESPKPHAPPATWGGAAALPRKSGGLLRNKGESNSCCSLPSTGVQAGALLRKNIALQWTRRVSNLCLVLLPCIVLLLVLGVQASAPHQPSPARVLFEPARA